MGIKPKSRRPVGVQRPRRLRPPSLPTTRYPRYPWPQNHLEASRLKHIGPTINQEARRTRKNTLIAQSQVKQPSHQRHLTDSATIKMPLSGKLFDLSRSHNGTIRDPGMRSAQRRSQSKPRSPTSIWPSNPQDRYRRHLVCHIWTLLRKPPLRRFKSRYHSARVHSVASTPGSTPAPLLRPPKSGASSQALCPHNQRALSARRSSKSK